MKRLFRIILLFIGFVGFSSVGWAQEKSPEVPYYYKRSKVFIDTTKTDHTTFRQGLFRYAPYGHSLLADVHPYFVRADIQLHTNRPIYDWAQTGDKLHTSITGVFGMKLPIWRGDFCNHKYGLAITMPASATLWLDVFEKVTAPVVNTDYRVSAWEFTFLHRINKGFVKNYAVMWSPFNHESTHIGDELQIQHVEQGIPLRRVNVSYNYTELMLTLNEAEDRYEQNFCFRLGLMLLFNPKAGWYFVDGTDGDASLIHPRVSPWEAYFQYQYQSPSSRHGFQGIFSLEVRNRALYGYPDFECTPQGIVVLNEGREDKRIFTYNVFVGARYNTPNYDGYFSRVSVGLRFYHGNNPNGQFRNIENYNQGSICLIFE